ncbi:unnamed protein product [Amaranthus hypochondriacus]
MLFLNYKLVMFASAITLLIIITSNTVLVTSSSESHRFVQHRQRKNSYGKMFPELERDDSIKTESGLKSENGSDDNKYEFSHNPARVTNTPSIGRLTNTPVGVFGNTPLIGRTGSTNTPIRAGLTTTGKSLNNKDNLSHVQPSSKQEIKDWKNKLLTKAAKEVVREIIDQSSACPVLGYNPYPIPNRINQYYFKRDNDRNISYVDCNKLNHTDPANSLASSKNYQNPINIQDLKIVKAYAPFLTKIYTSIGQIYLPITL